MRFVNILFAACGALALALVPQRGASQHPSDRCGDYPLVGWLERVKISQGDVVVVSSLMAGGEGAEIHADQIKQFERNGQAWVKFVLTNYKGDRTAVERELIRVAKIRRSDGTTYRRYVVNLGICIGDAYVETQVRLQDRANREHRMFIGRDVLAGKVIVNPAVSFSMEPVCKDVSKK